MKKKTLGIILTILTYRFLGEKQLEGYQNNLVVYTGLPKKLKPIKTWNVRNFEKKKSREQLEF